MIQWKVSAISFAVGALATVGFVWLRSRSRGPHALKDIEAPFDAEAAARSDAFHDVGDAVAELDLTEPMLLEPLEVRSLDEEAFERTAVGERYDAVDPEDVGAEFLQRATEAAVLHPPTRPGGSPAELLPTDEELEQRRIAREEHAGPGKAHE
jgi:hypothetical protein